jgi:hypothetical protein
MFLAETESVSVELPCPSLYAREVIVLKATGYLMTGLLILSTLSIFGCGSGGGNSAGGSTSNPVDAGPSELSITSTSSGGGATGVAVDADVTVTFSSNIDTSTLNSSTFTLTGPDGPIAGSVSYDSETRTATFSPSHSLPPLTQYTATITTGVRNVDGNALSSPYSWSFTTISAFWVYNFVTDAYYLVNATKAGEGQHCYVYVEQGQSVSPATVTAIINEFDNAIYTGDTTAFGSEPNPGVDGDSKIYLLLLDIKDGFNRTTNPTYVAGYFDPENEYTEDQFSETNLKEMFYMDINPAQPDTTDFYATLAHEFQHLIHWEQKTNLQGLNDDTWLDEGMSTVARTYCGLGTDTDDTHNVSLLSIYEDDPSHSLTHWDSTVDSYAVAYMWSQYFKDQFDPLGGQHTIFWRMIHNDQTGINSVNAALADISSGKNFTGTFRDWTVANAFGNNTPPSTHPEWSYNSLAGWGGIYATGAIASNAPTLSPLNMWSAGYYAYTPNPDGTITWIRTNSLDTATLIDTGTKTAGSWTVVYSLVSGDQYGYKTEGYLIDQNPSGSSSRVGDGVTNNAMGTTPRQMLDIADRNPVLWNHYRRTGRPTHICVDSYFRGREMGLRAGGALPHFAPPGRR